MQRERIVAKRIGLCGTLLGIGFGIGMSVTPSLGLAQTEREGKQPQVLKEQDLEKIQQRLKQLTENHQRLFKELEEIKAELAIVKIRVTN